MVRMTSDIKRLIVSRHPAAVTFIRRELPEFADAPVLAAASAHDVLDAVVAGNLPLHLAVLAREVIAVEFAGDAPRGAEYGLAEMDAAGARLARYVVRRAEEDIAPRARAIADELTGPEGLTAAAHDGAAYAEHVGRRLRLLCYAEAARTWGY